MCLRVLLALSAWCNAFAASNNTKMGDACPSMERFSQNPKRSSALLQLEGRSSPRAEVRVKELEEDNSAATEDTIAKFVELSDILPGHAGKCPHIDGYPDDARFAGAEIEICDSLVKKEEADGLCLIYNFGVGTDDPFLSKFVQVHPDCEVFAFDPFYHESEIPEFPKGTKLKFYSWGLWNGKGSKEMDRVSKGGEHYKAYFKTLHEFQKDLGHLDKHISVFRSDCEGCEWGWVEQAKRDDPTMFARINQMFMEVHTVKVQGMPTMEQDWINGLPARPNQVVGTLHGVLTENFRVLKGDMNCGYPGDRNQVPDWLQSKGVAKYPCCRQMNLINMQVSDAKSESRSQLDTLSPAVRGKFHGERGTCKGEVSVIGDIHFCEDLLRNAEKGNGCIAYIFGASTDNELDFLRTLRSKHPECKLHIFDPKTTSEKVSHELGRGASMHDLSPNLIFQPWGLYGNEGHRVVKSDNGNVGELYTLPEMLNTWVPTEQKTDPNPERITLFKVDLVNYPKGVWDQELQKKVWNWWGSFNGLDSIEQIV